MDTPAPRTLFDRIDRKIVGWMAEHGITLLRISLGIVFLWFGALKFFPHMSPAEMLAGKTIAVLTFDTVQPAQSLPVLAAWECLIGLGLLTGVAKRVTLLLLFVQMTGTLLPLALFPKETWAIIPLVPTLEGQYIIKNLVLISAGIVIGATVRGDKPQPGRR
ncbi:MAG: DoxX family membrane protein [Candidatus Eremiobacteraeota bacterium]|nr:DoxX family membrane protein [Candidatus Eremiobacteraeota bacterium]